MRVFFVFWVHFKTGAIGRSAIPPNALIINGNDRIGKPALRRFRCGPWQAETVPATMTQQR